MKKRLIWIVSLALVAMLAAMPAAAAGSVDASVSADSTSVNAGSTVTVTVSAQVDACVDGGVEVSFDSDVFELTGGRCTLSDADIDYFDTSSRDGAFAFSDPTAISGSAFSFTLKVKDSAPSGSHTVSVTFIADGVSVSRSLTVKMACEHSYSNDCDDTCDLCGGTRQVSHKYDSGKVTRKATCSKEGVKTYTCTSCGQTRTETIPKADHSWDSGKLTREPTCAREGEKSYTCTVCGQTKTQSVDTLDHEYEVTGYVGATCEENGTMVFTCVDCGYSYDDYIEAKGHSYDSDCDETCNTCGQTREVEHDFDQEWLSDEQGHWHQCQACGKEEEPTPHEPGPAATETEDQVCLECGYVLQTALTHTHKAMPQWHSTDEKHWAQCQCGQVMLENEHYWTAGEIREGMQYYSCVICGHIRTEPVETAPPPTEQTTAPTETTQPTAAPTEEIPAAPGILEGIQWWVVAAAALALVILGAGGYVTVGLILGFRKKGKYDKKKK